MNRRAVSSWLLYDWANSAFVLTVVTAFFPVLFKSYWCADVDATISTARLGIGNAAAGFIVALFSPFLGALADRGFGKKKLLAICVAVGAFASIFLGQVPSHGWIIALGVFLIASIAFNSGNIFYDALLIDVAEKDKMDWVSSAGYAAGYLGSGLLFLLMVLVVNNPLKFGFRSTVDAAKMACMVAGVWWLLFSFPLFLFVKERRAALSLRSGKVTSVSTIRQVLTTAGTLFRQKQLLLFLCAYWCYIDGVHTFVLMAVDFGMSIGIGTSSLMVALLVVQFVAFPSALLFGKGADRFGAYPMLFLGIGIYVFICTFGALFLKTSTDYIILAGFTGIAQGGLQALSRSVFGKMVPPEKSAEYYGFFNIVSRFAVIVGPLLVAGTALFAKQAGLPSVLASRIGMSSVALLFIAGALLLSLSSRIKNVR